MGGDGVAPDDQYGVRDQQADRVLAIAAVPDSQPVHAYHPVQPGHAAHEQHFHHDQVGAQETGHPARGCQPRPGPPDAGRGRVVPPHVDDAPGTDGYQQGDHAFSRLLAEAQGAPVRTLRRRPGLSSGRRQSGHITHFRPSK